MTKGRKISFKGPMAMKMHKPSKVALVPAEDRLDSFLNLLRYALVALFVVVLLLAVFAIAGCSTAKVKAFDKAATRVLSGVTEAAKALESEPTPVPWPTPAGADQQYVVVKGDNLWNITKKGGDPFLWPLIWKSNRDQIVDPDWIEPGQELAIPYAFAETEIHWARDYAERRPRQAQKRSMRKP